MKPRVLFALVCLTLLNLHAAVPPDYESLKTEAERFYAEHSFARAKELYDSVALTNLPPAERRWVQFRRADTQWRSQAGTQAADTTQFEEARQQLEILIRDTTRVEDRDRLWAEVQESLADFHWLRPAQQNWGLAWQHYQQALDWWAGQSDLNLAQERYLAIVWRVARPPGFPRDPYYNYWGNHVPPEILENALKIARTDNEKARAHFYIAMSIRNQGGDWARRARVPEEFEGALKAGKTTDWYDDALFNYAQWMEQQGHSRPLENGGWEVRANFVKALELYRRLVGEFQKGETRYWDQAERQIEYITRPMVGVQVANIFLPDSEIQFSLSWRNVKQAELALYEVRLNRDVQLRDEHSLRDWLGSIDLTKVERVKAWTRETKDAGDHHPGSEQVRYEEKLRPGAYLLVARHEGAESRDLILVTDAALVLKTSGKQTLAYVCNALDGSPLANSEVKLWEQWWENGRQRVRSQVKQTGEDGLVVFEHPVRLEHDNVQVFASSVSRDRQAFSFGNGYGHFSELDSWRIYAFTDRPAYRPNETVNWKFVARHDNGSVYSTPAEATIWHQVRGPDGAVINEGELKLNAFGSVSGALELTETMRLGEYEVSFFEKDRQTPIGGATLFRLEEYKLPEFKVSVQTPEENGMKKSFRLGEQIEVAIQADYYFGGPVANASVEVVVHQSPLWRLFPRPREFPWLYEDMAGGFSQRRGYGRYYGGEQIIKRETLRTDALGKVTLTFDTPVNQNQDFEYRIEARVTDASRREIVGNGTVRVTRQRYAVDAKAAHNLYRPQDRVTVNFKALDANEQPVRAEGTVKVTRDYWFEIWLAPDGREVKGDELKRLQAQSKIWPPPPERPDEREWRLKFRGYEHDEILTRSLQTDTNGAVELTFTPEREGYYRMAWTSEDKVSNPKPPVSGRITAETTVWVANNATTELGYRTGGIEIIADKDTFRVGQRAPVMLVANSPERYVLFSVEGEDLQSYQLVHLQGTVKLIELNVEERHTPNIFLSAFMVSDREIFNDTKQIVVPPTKNFLTVDVKPDRAQYQPQDEGTLTVTTRNDQGEPVSAEIALSFVDESVFYIQGDYAGDPRQFFFGEKRGHQVQLQSTMNQKSYARLIRWEEAELIDERDKRQMEEAKWNIPTATNFIQKSGESFDVSRAVSRARQAAGRRSGERFLAGAATFSDSLSSVPEPAMMELSAAGKMGGNQIDFSEDGFSEAVVIVRTDFRSTIFWQPDIVTDRNGQATVKVKYPDSLTGWKATARAVSAANQFGIGHTNTRTKQPLIVRLQAPRFFVVGDKVTISAVYNNNTDAEMAVKPAINVEGIPSHLPLANRGAIIVPANGEARADWELPIENWSVPTLKTNQVKITVSGRSGQHADAMERTYPLYEHGLEKFISKSGKARANDFTIKLDLPKERKAGSTSLTVQITPSLAVTMLDALPYLIDYPYGCTEQTMSRFLPAVITAKTLRDLGLEPADVMGRIFGGIETNTAAATHPRGKKDLEELDKIVNAGLERLYDFQHADGGWGWWKEGESDQWMTAYVVWGLTLAKQAGVSINMNAMNRGAAFLDKELVEEDENYDMQAFMLHALAAYFDSTNINTLQNRPGAFQTKAFENLWKNRDKLNAYTRSLLALSAHYFGKESEAKTLIENLENGVIRDDRPDTSVVISPLASRLASDPSVQGTAHWGNDGLYWRWSEGGVEATAFALRAMMAIDPANKLIEPTANWLIKNRRGAQWSNTRDTAIVVLAMNDYLRQSGELRANLEYELLVNGRSVAKRQIRGAEVFNAPSRFAIDSRLIQDSNEIRIRVSQGSSETRPAPLYFAVEGTFFSLEEPITAAGNEIFVKREYFKLVSRPTLLKGHVFDRIPLRDGESVNSGERVETVLTIEGKNNYEYLVFEDLKPAGLEAVAVRSGESLYAKELKSGAVARLETRSPTPETHQDFTDRSRWVYQELRDRKVAMFLDKLPEGVWQIRYELRAEVPGTFHALPVVGHAMYVPEIRCNGAEVRITVEDTAP